MPPRLAVVAAAMLSLLAVVALASRGGSPASGGAGERTPSTLFWDYLFTGALVLMALGLAVFVLTITSGREGFVEARRKRGNQAIAGLVFFGVALGLLFAVRAVRGDQIGPPRAPTTPAPAAEGELRPQDEERGYTPEFRWEPVAALVLAGAAATAFLVVRARRARPAQTVDDDALDADLAGVLDDTIDDLLAEPDPRRAVIAAYARMERSLAAHGLPRDGAEAPLEFLERASGRLRGRHPAATRLLFELTHLFERAKFSAQTVDRTMKEDAIETLTALRAELGRAAA